MKRGLLGLVALLTLACAHIQHRDSVPAGAGPLVAVYKATIDDGRGTPRRAKLSVWAERPDRLHAELIAPVGGVAFVLDAGGGQVCIVDVGESTAYVGPDGPGAIEAIAGVRLSVADAVAALFDGASPAGLTVSRDGASEGTLPDTLRITDGTRALALDRVRYERGRADARPLGTGAPPDRLAVRPLDSLAPEPANESERSQNDR